jgi:RHS repeat-associated protein
MMGTIAVAWVRGLALAALLSVWVSTSLHAEVSARGSYQTSIDILVPKFHTIAPSIRLFYDSNGGNGPLGMGWSLSAASEITRTSRLKGAPRYNGDDQFWLDGMELVPCASAPQSASCTSNGTHATRVEAYKRITRDDNANTWTVWDRDGTRYLYAAELGNTSALLTTRKWLLAQVVDTHNNKVTYSYGCGPASRPGSSCYLTDITYGDGVGCNQIQSLSVRCTPPRGTVIHFYWEPRPDPLSSAVGGDLETSILRLKSISVSHADKLVRIYEITYQPDPNGALGYWLDQSWVQSIQLFGSDAVVDASGHVSSGTAAPATLFAAPAQLYAPAPAVTRNVPANGQFLLPERAKTALPAVYPGFTTQSNMLEAFDPSLVPIPTYNPALPYSYSASNTRSVVLGDFDGDGKLDLLTWAVNAQCNELSTRTMMASWAALPEAIASAPKTTSLPQANGCITQAFAADLDGDGRTDILFLRYRRVDPFDPHDLTFEADAITAISNGDGSFKVSFGALLWLDNDPHRDPSHPENQILQSRCGIGDLNGDGRSDLVCIAKVSGMWEVVEGISGNNGTMEVRTDHQSLAAIGLTDNFLLTVADANGDGRSDLLIVDQRPTPSGLKLDVRVGTSLGGAPFFSWRTQPTNLDFVASSEKGELLTGDFNGDGRADLLLVVKADHDAGGSFTLFASGPGASPPFTVNRHNVSGEMPFASVADLDGDGLDDILLTVREPGGSCGSTVPVDHQSFTKIFSDGSGDFPVPSTFNACYAPSTAWYWDASGAYLGRAANVNGDSVADIFFYVPGAIYISPTAPGDPSGLVPAGNYYGFVDLPGTDSSFDTQHWRATDINGDGLADWVYVRYANPGLTVLSQIGKADGSLQLVRQDVPLSPAAGPLSSLEHADLARNWFLADIGGGTAGAPDGKADIVIADDSSQQVVALIADGAGNWGAPHIATYSALGIQFLTVLRGSAQDPKADVNGWRLLDVNGDGRADLVHLAINDVAGQLYIETTVLLSDGNGGWSNAIDNKYAFGGRLTSTDIRHFMPMDINDDHRMDLVALVREQGQNGQNGAILSLISNGDGSFEDHYAAVMLPNEATASWQPMEVNGDGSMDLVSFSAIPGSPFVISSMLALGNGNWGPVQTVTTSPSPVVDMTTLAEFRFADLDGDGRDDIVHLTRVGANQMTATVIWNRLPNFVQTTSGIQLSGGQTVSWQLTDIDGDDRPELVRVAPRAGSLDVISIPVREPHITHTENGMGASEDISYTAVVETDRSMPYRAIPHVVKSVSARARDTTAYDAVTTYSYAHAGYSWIERRFLGFAHTENSDGQRLIDTDFQLGDDCSAQVTQDELHDAQNQLIDRNTYTLAPTGATNIIFGLGAHAFGICRTDTIHHEEWEGATSPRKSETQFSYDGFGNIKEIVQTGDLADPLDDKDTVAQFNPNPDAYIVNRIASAEVYGKTSTSAGIQPVLLSRSHYEYDGSLDYTFQPGTKGELSRIRHWNDQTNDYVDTQLAYDPAGNLKTLTGPPIPSNPSGVAITITYDLDYDLFPEKVCDPLHCTTTAWDKQIDKVHSTVGANGQTTIFGYDALGRPQSETRPDGSVDHWIWPTAAQWKTTAQALRHELSDGSPGDGVLWDSTTFDGLGRSTHVDWEGGISADVLNYDGLSTRALAESLPHFAQDPPAITKFAYDAAGRPTSVEHPDQSVQRTSYYVGRKTLTDELGQVTAYDIDAFGRVTAIREDLRNSCGASLCAEFAITRYGYDALDRLLSIIDAKKNETAVQWDSLSRQLSVRDPDRGLVQFKWNNDASEASETDANGSMRSMIYDTIGRLASRTSTNASQTATQDVQWLWDNDPQAPSGFGVGHVVKTTEATLNAKLSSHFHYDQNGRPDQQTQCIDVHCYELALEFDSAGRVKHVTYPSASGTIGPTSPFVDYRYDDSGQLASIPGVATRLVHDAMGHTTEILFANGVDELRQFDPKRSWLVETSITHVVTHQTPALYFKQTLAHDLVGRISAQDVVAGAVSYHDGYQHDGLGRLTAVASSAPARNRTFKYDEIGNLIFHSQLGSISYDDPNHAHAMTATSSGAHFGYDLNGQMKTSSLGFSAAWGDDARPVAIKSGAPAVESLFAYDENGIRVKSSVNGQVTYDPFPVVQIDPQGAVIPSIMAEGRRVALLRQGLPFLLHADGLGSNRVVTDKLGAVVGGTDFDTWGKETAAPGGTANPFRYAGSRSDDQTGLDYMRARFYDPRTAHWISADEMLPDIYNPQSLNHYAYALNDPVTFDDPSGYDIGGPDITPDWGLDLSVQTPPAPATPVNPPGSDPSVMQGYFKRPAPAPALRQFQWQPPDDPPSEVGRQFSEAKRAGAGVATTLYMSLTLTDFLFPTAPLLGVPELEQRAAGLSFEELGSASLLDKGLELGSRRNMSLAQAIHLAQAGGYKPALMQRVTAVAFLRGKTGEIIQVAAVGGSNLPRRFGPEFGVKVIRSGDIAGIADITNFSWGTVPPHGEELIMLYSEQQGYELMSMGIAGRNDFARTICPGICGLQVGSMGGNILGNGRQVIFPGGR